MDQSAATSRLAELTGTLRPTVGATDKDLIEARAAIAASLLHNAPDLSMPSGELPLSAATPTPDLGAIVSQAATTTGPVPLAFRRSVPFRSVTNPSAVPNSTAGMAATTLGPFVDANGQLHWVDLFQPLKQTEITRSGAAAPFLLLPLTLPSGPMPTTINLGAGSIWIESRILSPTAPAGGYTGLTISGGTISFSTAPSIVSGNVQVGAADTVTLTIKLNAPSGPTGGTGLGVDGGGVVASFPAEVSFSFAPAGGAITAAADAALTVYGNTIPMHWHAAVPVYETQLNQILVEFTTTTAVLTIGQALSPLLKPQGQAAVITTAWALPVAVTAPAQLGAAAGDGALAIVLGPGLSTTWRGLAGGPAPLAAAFLLCAAGGLELIAAIGRNAHLAEHLSLWPEAPPPSMRRSSLELTFPQSALLFFTSVADVGAVKQTEAMACGARIAAHLDRPLGADGGRIGPDLPGSLLVFETAAARGLVVSGKAPATTQPGPTPIALALTNALLVTTPAESLLLVASFTTAPTAPLQGNLLLGFGFIRLLPMLPDPYAANFLPEGDRNLQQRTGNEMLVAAVHWSQKASPRLAFTLSGAEPNWSLPSAAASAAAPSLTMDVASSQAREDQAWVATLGNLFHETIGAAPATLFLLDVSGNVDQFGVGIAPNAPGIAPGGATLQILGMNLVAPGRNLRVFTVPQVQWEPVVNLPNPDAPFPSPVAFLDDGGRTLLGSNDVTLLPVAPAPVLDQLITAYESGAVTAAALFTLPFGMKAVATLPKRSLPHPVTILPPNLSAVRPNFATKSLVGGRQVSLTAGARLELFGGPSPSLPGATVQLRNLVDRTGNANFPGFTPPPQPPLSVLGPGVDKIFNDELAPGGRSPFVPVTRIDFSGYGESTFSDWVDPSASASPPSVTQAHFDVIVGRTSREVVQVKSMLYPWGAIVVRTITIERQGDAEVTRYDSGWIAVTPGTFNLPGGTTVHPGVVQGAYNIREIRDTTQVYTAGVIEMRAVYFDADIAIDNVTSGARKGRVPSTGQLGFVQTGGPTIGPADLAALIASEGALGGPVDCVIAVAGTQQPMQLARVEVATAPHGGTDEFAAVARGSLTLPAQGSWSVVQLADSVSEPQAIDADLGLPLIREGAAGTSSSAPYRFAQALDLLTSGSPSMDYALMHATSATRILFPRPKIETGANAFTSTATPLLADGFALMEAVGIAPRQDSCLTFPNEHYELQIGGPGILTLAFSPNQFPPSRAGRTLATGAAATIGLEYANENGNPCQVDVAISPAGWSIRLTGLNVRLDMGPFTALMRTAGDMRADSASGTEFANPRLVLGPVLQPLGEILTFLEKLGLPDPFAVAFSNSGWQETKKYKMKAGLQFSLPMKKSEGAPFDIPTDTPFGTFSIGLKVGYGNVASSESALFTGSAQWLAYLGFNGSLQVPVFPAVKVGGLVIFKMEVDFPNGSTPGTEKLTLQLGVIITAGGDLVPGVVQLKASVSFAVTLIVVTSTPGSVGIGVGLIMQASGQILSGLVGISFTAEADGLYIDSPKEIQATFDIQVDVSICWFLDVDFEVQTQYTKTLS